MKDFEPKNRERCYELNEDQKYKRMNIDFNEYGFNPYSSMAQNLNFDQKRVLNCVKRKIKR